MTDTKENQSTRPNPHSGTTVSWHKPPIPPDREQPSKPEVYETKPRVIVKVRDSSSLPGEGFSASDLFVKESVEVPDFAYDIRFRPHFRPDLLECVKKRYPDIKRHDQGMQRPNLEAWHDVVVPDTKHREWLLAELRDSDDIEISYLHPGPVAPPVVNAADDPLSKLQSYLKPAPEGIDAEHAWTVAGGDGKTLKLADVEWGWNLNQEDLEGINFTNIRNGCHRARAHGTKVLGVIASRDNTKFCVGITPNLPSVVTSGQWKSEDELVTGEAVLEAICELNVGDVLLLEAQTTMFGHKNIPLEAEPVVFDLVWIATYLGIVVVAAAGNGDVDLDQVTDDYGVNIFDRNVPNYWHDSGAIIVGSAYQDINKQWQRLGSSCFGSRVDCFASGDQVVTLSSDPEGNSRDEWSDSFSATSAATAIVTGAALAVQGTMDARGDPRLSSREMRVLLSDPQFNTKSNNPPLDMIGVMPDLKHII